MNKKSIVIIVVVIVIVIVFFLFYPPRPVAQYQVIEATLHNERLELEVADTVETQKKGLSGRALLGDHQGMLFVFSEAGLKNFWMKDMKFPIDIVWLRDNRVVGWMADMPLPTGKTFPLYLSPEMVNGVLELKAGSVRRWKIEIGDRLLYH